MILNTDAHADEWAFGSQYRHFILQRSLATNLCGNLLFTVTV
jgi:hypothetical protein